MMIGKGLWKGLDNRQRADKMAIVSHYKGDQSAKCHDGMGLAEVSKRSPPDNVD